MTSRTSSAPIDVYARARDTPEPDELVMVVMAGCSPVSRSPTSPTAGRICERCYFWWRRPGGRDGDCLRHVFKTLADDDCRGFTAWQGHAYRLREITT